MFERHEFSINGKSLLLATEKRSAIVYQMLSNVRRKCSRVTQAEAPSLHEAATCPTLTFSGVGSTENPLYANVSLTAVRVNLKTFLIYNSKYLSYREVRLNC